MPQQTTDIAALIERIAEGSTTERDAFVVAELVDAVQPLITYLDDFEARTLAWHNHPLPDAAFPGQDLTSSLTLGTLRRIARVARRPTTILQRAQALIQKGAAP
jgi:hypothetical protein